MSPHGGQVLISFLPEATATPELLLILISNFLARRGNGSGAYAAGPRLRIEIESFGSGCAQVKLTDHAGGSKLLGSYLVTPVDVVPLGGSIDRGDDSAAHHAHVISVYLGVADLIAARINAAG